MGLNHTLPEKFLFVIGSIFLSALNFFLIKEYLGLFYIVVLPKYYLGYYILMIIFFKNINWIFSGRVDELQILKERIITKELKEDYNISYKRYLPRVFSNEESFSNQFTQLLKEQNFFRLDENYGNRYRRYRLVPVPGKYPYPLVNYYYYEYFRHLSAYYVFAHSFYTFTYLIILLPKLCFVVFYFISLLYQLVPDYGHIEVLKLGPLLNRYPFLNYVRPYLELDRFGDLKITKHYDQSISKRLHFFLFYNLFIYTYYYALEHAQSILYIFVKYHYTRDWVVSCRAEVRLAVSQSLLSLDSKDHIVPRGIVVIKIRNRASIFSKIIMLIMYLLSNHSFKLVNFFTTVHSYSKGSHDKAVKRDIFTISHRSVGAKSLLYFFKNNLLWESKSLPASKFIAKDTKSDILMYEDSSPLTMSPRHKNFFSSSFSTIHNVVTLVRYINFNKTTHIDYIWKEIPLHTSYYDWD